MTKTMDMLTSWLLGYESGKLWYNKLVSDATKRSYLPNFKLYCDSVEKNPDELIELKIEGLGSVRTCREFQAETLLETYLSGSSLTPNMQKAVQTSGLAEIKVNFICSCAITSQTPMFSIRGLQLLNFCLVTTFG